MYVLVCKVNQRLPKSQCLLRLMMNENVNKVVFCKRGLLGLLAGSDDVVAKSFVFFPKVQFLPPLTKMQLMPFVNQ